jgi:hypothetical protein
MTAPSRADVCLVVLTTLKVITHEQANAAVHQPQIPGLRCARNRVRISDWVHLH